MICVIQAMSSLQPCVLLISFVFKKLPKSSLEEATCSATLPIRRSGPKKGTGALKFKKRQECLERQSSARGDVVEDLRATTEEPAESQMWIDDNFQRFLKKLVHSVIDAENQLFALQERKQRLESFKSDGKVPKGLKISNVAA